MQILTDFASKRSAKPYIIGCTDEYALFIIENKEFLSEYFTVRAPDESALGFADKTEFYKECERLSLPHPEYAIAKKDAPLPDFDSTYPVVVKPPSSSEYWKHPFPNMRKVYFAENAAEASGIVNKIYLSGYGRKVLIQKMIPGNKQYVLTA
ncbi:MAG: ATP-grasp domain-containing protein, partial [Clostridiales bacterium]|nr:ATP-grasp domain-containing protein [Clostridiales bacterium]